MQRANRIVSHLNGQPAFTGFTTSPTAAQSDDDVVICSAKRTAIGKAKKGGFRNTHPGKLLSTVLRAVCEDAGIKPEQVNEITVGNVLTPGAFAGPARMAAYTAGFPDDTTVHTINRQCSSGLQATASAAAAIKAGHYEIAIAAGVESMSSSSMGGGMGDLDPDVFKHDSAKQCLTPMGITSENVSAKYGITREQQDALAVESNARAIRAIKEGRFKSEIVPLTTTVKDKEGKESTVTVDTDEGPRAGTSLESLAKLKPAFKKGGSTTAGNSSQTSDGAAAVLLMKRSTAKKLGAPILGTFADFTVVGVPPAVMGIGPAFAIPALLKKNGLNKDQVDVYEVNEAFASQAIMSCQTVGLDMAKVNPNGGAIALGHPLGCTGARQIATIMAELKRSGGKNGVISMCIGTGMGAAALVTRE